MKLTDVIQRPHEAVARIQALSSDNDRLRIEIERLQSLNRWIPVSERLPEYGHAVLIMTSTSVVPKIGVHSPAIPQWATTDLMYYHDISYSMVTHWRSLPSSPEVTQ